MHDVVYRGEAAAIPVFAVALRQALPSWDGLIEWLPMGIFAYDREGTLVQYNRKAAELWGRSPKPGDTRFRIADAYRSADGRPLPPAEAPLNQVLQTGEPVRDREVIVERPDGSRFIALVNADPLFDADGEIVGGVSCFQDITERKRSEEALRERERRFSELLDALPAAIYTTDSAGRITFYNQAAVDFSGRRPQLGTDEWCVTWRLYSPDGKPLPHTECPMAIALKEGRPVRGAEAIAERPDGSKVPFIPYPAPLRDASGAVVGAVNMLVDISERKQAETRQALLIGELNHRVKNTLAIIQAIAAQTLQNADSLDDFRASFQARVMALSHAHDLLTNSNWEGANLRDIVGDAMMPFQGDAPSRCAIAGEPNVRIGPQSAVILAVAFHELATNAAKYGALSNDVGQIAIAWNVRGSSTSKDRTLQVTWTETGGSPVSIPAHTGFGLKLIGRALAKQFDNVRLDFAPQGLVYSFEVRQTGDVFG